MGSKKKNKKLSTRKDIKKRINKNEDKTKTKNDSKNVTYCPNCKSDKVKDNQPRSVRIKINAISVAIILLTIIAWTEISDSMEASPTIYLFLGIIVIGLAASKILKSQYQCKNCTFSWDKKS